MTQDHELHLHRDWIGLLRPVGLVVSPPALLAAQAIPDKNIAKQQQILLSLLTPPAPKDAKKSPRQTQHAPLDFHVLASQVLGWKSNKLVPLENLPESLSIVLPEFGETLRPTYAVPAPPDAKSSHEWLMLVQELPDGTPFDDLPPEEGRRWRASPHVRFERLVRETGVCIGILANRRQIRLVYAPRGESSGHITWPLHRLVTTLDAPMLSALCMLLGPARLFTLPRDQRLPQLLEQSRKYQNVVSTKLAGQVLEALNELLRGFQAANEATRGELLDDTISNDPEHVYGGLLAVLLRLVFLLYAEERGLLSSSPIFVRHYSLLGLFEKLRSDAGRFPDTMDQRHGAWSRLLVLFRMIHDGAKRGDFRLPPRYGHLFDPDVWNFLEGRPQGVGRVKGALVSVPKIADGVLLRVLEKLVLLDGDRLSYRALDVEQIGSVYENMMGFRLERAGEISIGVGKEHVVVGLETLLSKKGAERDKYLKESANVELSGKAGEALRAAKSVDDVIVAFGKRISALTPRTVPAGGLYLQPTDERRRSGSHYTPRELTEPIVRTTLRPILEDLGTSVKPEAILSLKVCDPAMGSGAFLVEACRQLAEQLVKAYDVVGRPGDVAPDEDIVLYAMRLVAQHCLYGVDKNPLAVDLGKLSLWLATLARDHAFTFLDHAIRNGDSLVGLSREQIASFTWKLEKGKDAPLLRSDLDRQVKEAEALRREIQGLANSDDTSQKKDLLDRAEEAIKAVRRVGDLVLDVYFSEKTDKAREKKLGDVRSRLTLDFAKLPEPELGGLRPFHWEVEFPEVFERDTPGFDCFVGNPPFLGGKRISTNYGSAYSEWLADLHEESSSNADLAAHFFRRAFSNLRQGGSFGLIATNTIAQGDTRASGLRWICNHGGTIYDATRRHKWPGLAAVIVSVVHVRRGDSARARLDGVETNRISAFLFHQGGDETPIVLLANAAKSFIGCDLKGQGFTFDDDNIEATSMAEMQRLVAKDPRNQERIFPYLGGEELNSSPRQTHERYVINFGEMPESEARRWPDLIAIVEQKVRPERSKKSRDLAVYPWWRFWRVRRELYAAIRGMDRVLACSLHSKDLSFAFLSSKVVFSHALAVFAFSSNAAFALLQCRPHELWARFFASTLEDRLRYTPSDCFETFPFPPDWEQNQDLEAAGKTYDEFRAALMIRNNEGLTKTYNRFHDPDESDSDILKLRDLHAAMDRAVLDAYAWTDLQPTCEFLLDYEDDEDDEESAGKRRKKKPWRYRWPDEIRDEVLARLLDLNAQRAKEEARGAHLTPPAPLSNFASLRGEGGVEKKKRGTRAKKGATTNEGQRSMFGKEEK